MYVRAFYSIASVSCLLIALNEQADSADTTMTYDDVHSRVSEMQAVGTARSVTQALVKDWIHKTGVDNLSPEKCRWCLEQVLPQKAERSAFSVAWTGKLIPPRTGKYVLSISPININKDGPSDEAVKHSMRVALDGKQVLNATSKKWQWKSDVITLQAGEFATIRVEMAYSSTDHTYGDSPHALLYWEGPGMSRQIIPNTAFEKHDGSGKGLRAAYTWQHDGQPLTIEQTNDNIEFAWASCRDIAPDDPELVAQLTDHLWTVVTASTYLTNQNSATRPEHDHIYLRNYTSTEFLSTPRRGQFIDLLTQYPGILSRANQTQLLRLYHVLRFGDEDGALDLLGAWMKLRADEVPTVSPDFFDANRRFYRTVALYLVFRASDPDAFVKFQKRYLDGGDDMKCCLPAAYTLAYSYLLAGRIDNWIELLEAKLKSESLTNECRVNWLIARAQAQEIRHASAFRYELPSSEVLAGLPWITEAHLCADDKVRGRIFREEVARLAATNQTLRTNTVLAAASQFMPKSDLNELRTQVDAASNHLTERQKSDALRAQSSYVQLLQKQRELASQRGDTAMVLHHDGILREIESEAK